MSVAGGKLILLGADEEANRELLVDILQAQGHRTELAKDGYEALAKLELGRRHTCLRQDMRGR